MKALKTGQHKKDHQSGKAWVSAIRRRYFGALGTGEQPGSDQTPGFGDWVAARARRVPLRRVR
jgi:hypothetical protein